jgi:hypothetical protein
MTNFPQHLNDIEATIDARHNLFVETKKATTQGKLKVVGNNVFINLANVLTVPGRFITEDEQKANMALWVTVKDDTLVEDLWVLQKHYKLKNRQLRMKLCVSYFLLIMTTIFIGCKYLFL